MGELGFSEWEVTGNDGETVCVRVGGDMEEGEIIIGTCASADKLPDRCVVLDDDGRRELIEILRRCGPTPRPRMQPHEPEMDIEHDPHPSPTRWRGICEWCGWKGQWKPTERAAETSAAMHASHARKGLCRPGSRL